MAGIGAAGKVWGLAVLTPAHGPAVYPLGEPSTRYDRVMTRAEWMPGLIGEVI